jgi:hypothetical protein
VVDTESHTLRCFSATSLLRPVCTLCAWPPLSVPITGSAVFAGSDGETMASNAERDGMASCALENLN